MPRGAYPYEGPVAWTVTVEDDPRFPIVTLSSDVTSEQRSGHHGALHEHEELLEQVCRKASVRITKFDPDQRKAIFHVNSWRVVTRCLREDVETVSAALKALSEGDPSQCRGFASAPMRTVLSEHRMRSTEPMKIR